MHKKKINILIMTIYEILYGLTDFTIIVDFLKLKEEYFTQLLKLENEVPSLFLQPHFLGNFKNNARKCVCYNI